MDSTHIGRVLRKAGKDTFYGVFPCDRLPTITHLPALIVANIDLARRSGQHWIAMYIAQDGTGELFDSLAQDPPKKRLWTLWTKTVLNGVVALSSCSLLFGAFAAIT